MTGSVGAHEQYGSGKGGDCRTENLSTLYKYGCGGGDHCGIGSVIVQ